MENCFGSGQCNMLQQGLFPSDWEADRRTIMSVFGSSIPPFPCSSLSPAYVWQRWVKSSWKCPCIDARGPASPLCQEASELFFWQLLTTLSSSTSEFMFCNILSPPKGPAFFLLILCMYLIFLPSQDNQTRLDSSSLLKQEQEGWEGVHALGK